MSIQNEEKKCEKNCPDYNGMEILHKEQCDCSCHISPPTEESWEERFDKKLKELKTDFDFEDEGTRVYEFGCRLKRKDEIFTLPDWGNIRSFIKQEIEKAYEEGLSDGRNIEANIKQL